VNYAFFKIISHFERDVELSSFKGSMLRGALGHALKDTVCAVRVKVCESCLLRFTCIYPSIFEPKPVADQRSGQSHRPHPYVLDTFEMNRGFYKAGEPFTFSLVLFGKATQYFPYFLYAFECMGRNGLGRRTEHGRGTFVLDEVKLWGNTIYTPEANKLPDPIPDKNISFEKEILNSAKVSQHIRINLLSPLRVKTGGSFARDFDFLEFLRFVLRRLRSLFCEFSETGWCVDEKPLLQKAKSIIVLEKNIRWEEQVRYSNRQKTKLFIGGLSGTFEVKGDLTPFIQFLKAAEIVHLGKETSFGLGRIKIENLN
jgi:CRISPR-associated endoribonuclease Cas6